MTRGLAGRDDLDRSLEVQATMREFLGALDTEDWARVAYCLTEDITAIYEGGIHISGRSKILRSMNLHENAKARRKLGLGEVRLWTHTISNMVVTAHPLGVQLETSVVSHVVHTLDEAHLVRVRGIRYNDVLVAAGDVWQIAHRRHALLWEYELPSREVRTG